MEDGEISIQLRLPQGQMLLELVILKTQLRPRSQLPHTIWKRTQEETSVKLIPQASLRTANFNNKPSIFLNWDLMRLKISMSPAVVSAFQKYQEVSTLAMELSARRHHQALFHQMVEVAARLVLWSLNKIPQCINLMLNNSFRDSLQVLSKRKQEMCSSRITSEQLSYFTYYLKLYSK